MPPSHCQVPPPDVDSGRLNSSWLVNSNPFLRRIVASTVSVDDDFAPWGSSVGLSTNHGSNSCLEPVLTDVSNTSPSSSLSSVPSPFSPSAVSLALAAPIRLVLPNSRRAAGERPTISTLGGPRRPLIRPSPESSVVKEMNGIRRYDVIGPTIPSTEI